LRWCHSCGLRAYAGHGRCCNRFCVLKELNASNTQTPPVDYRGGSLDKCLQRRVVSFE
jgi:hypothetical protein